MYRKFYEQGTYRPKSDENINKVIIESNEGKWNWFELVNFWVVFASFIKQGN